MGSFLPSAAAAKLIVSNVLYRELKTSSFIGDEYFLHLWKAAFETYGELGQRLDLVCQFLVSTVRFGVNSNNEFWRKRSVVVISVLFFSVIFSLLQNKYR